MPKVIRNPISCVVTENDGEHRCRADYEVESEGIKQRRSIQFELEENTVNDIHEQTMAAINAEEGTTGDAVPEEPEEPEPEPE